MATTFRFLNGKSLIVPADLFILDRQREVNQHAAQFTEGIHSSEGKGVLGEDSESITQLAQAATFMR
jgi:hypothetical protein